MPVVSNSILDMPPYSIDGTVARELVNIHQVFITFHSRAICSDTKI